MNFYDEKICSFGISSSFPCSTSVGLNEVTLFSFLALIKSLIFRKKMNKLIDMFTAIFAITMNMQIAEVFVELRRIFNI